MKFIDLTGQRFGRYVAVSRHSDKMSWMCQCDCGTLQRVTTANLRSRACTGCKKCADHGRKNLIGRRFGKLVVASYFHTKKKVPFWVCRCDCGGEKVMGSGQLRAGSGLHCGCVKPKTKPIIDLTGQRFGRLLVLRRAGMDHHNATWECKCDCGNLKVIISHSLRKGTTNSCGCLQNEIRSAGTNASHGESREGKRTLRYTMWVGAKKRSRDQKVPFDLKLEDIVIPKICPILGIPLKSNKGGKVAPGSPTLDKIIPNRGYIRGNVWVISYRANAIKLNATVEELEKVAIGLRRKIEELNQAA